MGHEASPRGQRSQTSQTSSMTHVTHVTHGSLLNPFNIFRCFDCFVYGDLIHSTNDVTTVTTAATPESALLGVVAHLQNEGH